MELILHLDNGVTVTATPIAGGPDSDVVGLAIKADTPAGPQSFVAQTTKSAVRAMLMAGKAKFGPKITAFLNRVRGLYNLPPMAPVPSPVTVDATAPGAPLVGLTGAGETSVSAGFWSYGPYASVVPISYRVRSAWNTIPWWWPRSWAWGGVPLQPQPYGYYSNYANYGYGWPSWYSGGSSWRDRHHASGSVAGAGPRGVATGAGLSTMHRGSVSIGARMSAASGGSASVGGCYRNPNDAEGTASVAGCYRRPNGSEGSVGAFFPVSPAFSRAPGPFNPITPGPGPAWNADVANGYQLAIEDARRACRGQTVYMADWIIAAGPDYLAGYGQGIAASGASVTPRRVLEGGAVVSRSQVFCKGAIVPSDDFVARSLVPGANLPIWPQPPLARNGLPLETSSSGGAFFPARPFAGFALPPPAPVTVYPAVAAEITVSNAPDYGNGYALGERDVTRARMGSIVYVAPWVFTAGPNYLSGYRAGVAASGGVLLDPVGGRTRVVVPTRAPYDPYAPLGRRGAGPGYPY